MIEEKTAASSLKTYSQGKVADFMIIIMVINKQDGIIAMQIIICTFIPILIFQSKLTNNGTS